MEDWIQKCDSGFNLYHKTDLVTGGSIHKRTERFILMQENCGDIPDKVLKLFVKERTFHDKGCGSNLFTYICSSISVFHEIFLKGQVWSKDEIYQQHYEV